MRLLQPRIPHIRKIHIRRVRLLVLNEAHTDDRPLLVLQEEPDALETTGIARPTTRARDAARELLVFISGGHASVELEFGDETGGRGVGEDFGGTCKACQC